MHSPEGPGIGDAFIQIEANLRQRGEEQVNLGNRLPEHKDQPSVSGKPGTAPFTGAAAKQLVNVAEEIQEEFDRDEDYDEDAFDDFAGNDKEEERSIEKLRKEEMRNRIIEKDKAHIEDRLSNKRLSQLEDEVRKKDI
jgi:hypothetical protein